MSHMLFRYSWTHTLLGNGLCSCFTEPGIIIYGVLPLQLDFSLHCFFFFFVCVPVYINKIWFRNGEAVM